MIYCPPYRAGPKERQFEKVEINKMLAMKVIRPAQIEWPESSALAAKKEGSLKLCVDFCKLNIVSIWCSFYVSAVGNCIDALGDATIFSTFDAKKCYWQVEIQMEHRKKRASAFHHGL